MFGIGRSRVMMGNIIGNLIFGKNKIMPSEYILKIKVRGYFEKQGYKIWFPPRVRYKKENDIFSIWDGVCWKKDKFIFFQITTLSNKSARLKKIVNYMLPNYLYMCPPKVKGLLMCWKQKTKEFVITKI